MDGTWKVTEADRDAAGNITVDGIAPAEPRSLADLLPKPEAIKQDAKRQPWTRKELATLAAVALCAAFVLVYAWATPRAPTAAPTPRATAGATVQPTAPPIEAPIAMLPAYAAPDGVQLGMIEATRALTPTAHYASDWIQADVRGSGLIWLRASDWPELAIIGPDLAPRPTIAPVYVAAPEPSPAPPSCAEAGIPGKIVRVCDYDSLAALEQRAKAEWLQTYGGNVGVISHPTPQIKEMR